MEIAIKSKEASIIEMIFPEIQNIDFGKIKFKLYSKENEEKWTKEKICLAEAEYKNFLMLIKLYPEKLIVPSKIMDEFWHMHILDTEAYRKDCKEIFGHFIDHYPYFGIHGNEDKQNLIDSFEETKKLYFKSFGVRISEFESARCEGKPCHAPTTCKCRGSNL